MKKYRPHPWRLIWRFLLVFLVLFLIFFAVSFNTYIGLDENGKMFWRPWEATQYIFFFLIIGLGVGTFIPSLTSCYYIIEHDYFIFRKYGKTLEFKYNNIEFIDIETSKRKNQVIFYSKTAKMRYLLNDKDGVLLDTIIKKCPNTLTVAEFREKHPEEKY